MIVELLCLCASQLFANAVTEGNFSSLTRFLAPQRLKSGPQLLAAQLLASKAQKWAQFDDPSRSVKKEAAPVPNNCLTRLFRPSGVASLSFGATAPLLVTPHDEDAIDVEAIEEAELQPSQSAAQGGVLPSQLAAAQGGVLSSSLIPTATTTTTTAAAAPGHLTRANRGVNMARIIRTVYGGMSRGAVGDEPSAEPAESDEDDPEYNV